MSYTVINLITDAFYTSNIRSRGLDTLSGEDLSVGLDLLNDFLAINSVDFGKIPYYQKYELVLVPGQELYFIPGLVDLQTFTFSINSVRYSLLRTQAKAYFGSARVNNIETLPYSFSTLRTYNGTNVYVYYLPDQDYPAEIYGRFILPNFNQTQLTQDLSTTFEPFYRLYIRYSVARLLCIDRKSAWDKENQIELQRLENYISNMSIYDVTNNRYTTFNRNLGINYAFVGLGRGFFPSS